MSLLDYCLAGTPWTQLLCKQDMTWHLSELAMSQLWRHLNAHSHNNIISLLLIPVCSRMKLVSNHTDNSKVNSFSEAKVKKGYSLHSP